MNKLFTGSSDRIIIKWDLDTFNKEHVFDSFHSGEINSLIFLNEEKIIVSGSEDKFINFFDTKTCSQIGTVEFDYSVLCLTKNREESKIICGGKDTQDLRIWNVSSVLKFCQEHMKFLRRVDTEKSLSLIHI